MRSDERDESRWVAACCSGDQSGCEALVRAHQDQALRTAFLISGHRQAAEDIAQNAFIQALRHLRRFDNERPFAPWLLKIVVNEARQYLRARSRRPADALPEQLPAQSDGVLTRLITNDERAEVRAALATLDEPFRTTVVLFYFNDLSVDEIAEVMSTRAGTVKSRLHRGREQLRRALQANTEETQPGWSASQ